MDKYRYPPHWDAVSRAVRDHAHDRCEWCGAPNGAIGYRDAAGYFTRAEQMFTDYGERPADWVGQILTLHRADDTLVPVRILRVVLTVAHLGAPHPGARWPWGDPHDKTDVRPENLAALCQRCHLGYDRFDHAKHAAATRHQKRLTRGEQLLPF